MIPSKYSYMIVSKTFLKVMLYVGLLVVPTEILMRLIEKLITQLEAQPMQCKQKRTIYVQPKSQVKLLSFL